MRIVITNGKFSKIFLKTMSLDKKIAFSFKKSSSKVALHFRT